MPPTYTIVIPAYNERARIRATLDRVLAHISDRRWDAEILVVNDGSRDDTAQIVENYSAQHPSLRLLLFTDADLSSPIEEADKLFAALEAGADVALGSRWLRAELQTQRQSLHRQLFGRIFNLALRIVLGLPYRDTQCGFKAFTRRAAQVIFPRQRIERWGFDPEILFLARKFGMKVEEVPVEWAHSEGTRINPLRDGIRMFVEMLRIRWYFLRGEYDKPPATL
jgi:glycosyltransferase involved in cell wall biosynthesis